MPDSFLITNSDADLRNIFQCGEAPVTYYFSPEKLK